MSGKDIMALYRWKACGN